MIQKLPLKKTCIAIGVAHALFINNASAATITVNSRIDNVDGPACTLREAIESINNGALTDDCQQTGDAFGVNDTIAFAPDFLSVSDLATTLVISRPVSINPDGDRITIESLGNDRVFEVTASDVTSNDADVTFNNVTIRGGNRQRQQSTSSYLGGGGILVGTNSHVDLIQSTVEGNSTDYAGGGILVNRNSTLTITDSVITNNTAAYGGGGIFSYSELSISNSEISNNTATSSGGGISTSIGIIGDVKLTIVDSTVSGNQLTNASAYGGGGIRLGGGEFNLINSAVSDNSAGTSKGGGLAFGTSRSNIVLPNDEGGSGDPIVATLTDSTISGNQGNGGGGISMLAGTFELNNTTISDNASSSDGGAIQAEQSVVSLLNSTLSGNSASGDGGAISIIVNDPDIQALNSTLDIVHSTISGNNADLTGGAIHLNIESGFNNTLSAANNLITGNSATNFNEVFNFGSTVSLFGVNLFGDSSSNNAQAFFEFNPGANDITATSNGSQPTPLSDILAPLADNGGPTQTHALIENSPAIDTANNSVCAAIRINNLDQRGVQRPLGLGCDIGSFESEFERQADTSFFVVPLPNGRSVIFEL